MAEQSFEARFELMLAEVAALRQQVTSQQAALNALQNPQRAATTTTSAVGRPATATHRRRMLRRLAGGLVAGLSLGGLGGLTGSEAEARTVSNPAGQNNQIGAIIVPPGAALPTGQINQTGNPRFGLIATDGSSLNLSTLDDFVRSNPAGVVGYASGIGNAVVGVGRDNGTTGVYGTTIGNQSYSLWGKAYGLNSYAIFTEINDPTSYAGYFQGKVTITGMFVKPGGSFKIDHPLDPANSYLSHSFVVSSQ